MKVLEAQSATLTNYEVFQHLVDLERRNKKEKRRAPPNLATLVRELLQYMRTHPNPMGQEPLTYTPDCIATLLERLRPFELAKGEIVMILNLRPMSSPALNAIIEDISVRFTDDQMAELLDIVAEVLGQFEVSEDQHGQDEEAEADESMNDAGGS